MVNLIVSGLHFIRISISILLQKQTVCGYAQEKKYIDGVKRGEKTKRIGRIISIDVEHNAAMAKAEIVIPGYRIFTDYFLLLRYEGSWKIVHKSYTWRPFPSVEEKKEWKT